MHFRIFSVILFISWLPYGNNFATRIKEIEVWTTHFGHHLRKFSRAITFVQEIRDKYASAELDEIDGDELTKETALDIEKFLRLKIEAVKRIADGAENTALGYQYDPDIKPMIKIEPYEEKQLRYPSANYLNTTIWPLEENEQFNKEVSFDFSTVQVDTNVFDQSTVILNGIEATRMLDSVFIHNYKHDPTLYWQYFGSAKGYLRLYPGIKWPEPYSTEDSSPADIYDDRLRPWFIEAAMSPKDIIILFDISGSMYGLRYSIAKYVVKNILDSLTQNDFVGVFKFSSEIENVVPCFNRSLVPAYGENLQLITEYMDGIEMKNKTNFTMALSFAFELLQEYNFSGCASQCNQAIMIVADGASENNADIFEKYDPDHKIRVFTYLIGREVTEYESMVWMACNQRGYYTQITDFSQVPDQVEKYILVMARPLAFQRVHPIIWTPLYADITNDKQKYQPEEMDKCELLTTVAMPVYNQSTVEVSIIEGNITKIEMLQKDELLGVAGVDVPIKQMKRLMQMHKMGVNGYPFILNDHGHIITHPYLQPYYNKLINAFHLDAGLESKAFYQELLKPGYSTVDLTDVEFGVSDILPWEYDAVIIELRDKMLLRKAGSLSLRVKVNYDHQKRVLMRKNNYYFTPIEMTPFSLAIVLPYTTTRIKSSNIDMLSADLLSSLENNRWSVHPDWLYCEDRSLKEYFPTPEKNVFKYMSRINQTKSEFLANRASRVKIPIDWTEVTKDSFKEENSNSTYFCDRDLLLNLIFDISATIPFATVNFEENEDLQFAQMLGISKVFVATHSGLTRWIYLDEDDLSDTYYSSNRAIQELWYSHAVDYNFEESESFVFSVPFSPDNYSDSYVIASHAIFVEDGERKTPAAVVGLQFGHAVLSDLVFNSTKGFDCYDEECTTPCSSSDVMCYIIDDSGYIILSEYDEDIGSFLGKIDGHVMNLLINEGIYESVSMYNFQATCLHKIRVSAANILMSPFKFIASVTTWLLQKLVVSWMHLGLHSIWDFSWLSSFADARQRQHYHHTIPKIKYDEIEPCVTNFTLYSLNKPALKMKPLTFNITDCKTDGCVKQVMVQRIPFTNLIMVATDPFCDCINDLKFDPTEPTEINLETYNMTECDLLKLNLTSKPQVECYKHHVKESKIRDCGRGYNLEAKLGLLIIGIFINLICSTCLYQPQLYFLQILNLS